MADNNTYTSKQNIKKYTTQAKFDAIDKSDVPVGTEYNIVGSITESDLDSDLQAKVNLAGDNLTTEVTGGKVKVKNPMTSTGGDGFKLNSFYNATTGVTYFFPIETPIGHFATGIVPILGSTKATLPGSTSPATYHGLFLQNAYTENNYNSNAFAMLTMSESHNSGNQIYILPYCSRNPGVSYLLNNESLIAGNGISIDSTGAGVGKLKISVDGSGGGGFPDVPGTEPYNLMATSGVAQWVLTDDAQAGELTRRWVQPEPPSGITGRVSLFRGWNPDTDGGSGTSAYILLLPTSNSTNVSVTLPAKSGTLATTDEVVTAYKTITLDDLNNPNKLETLKSGFYYMDASVTNAAVTNTTSLNIARAPQPSIIDPALPSGQYYVIINNDSSRSDKSSYYAMAFAQNVKTQELYNICFAAADITGWRKIATLDDIPTGGGITTTELNETPSSPKTITLAELKALDTGFYNASNCILKGDADLPRGYYHLIKIKAANGTDGSLIAQDHDNGSTYVLTFRLSGGTAVGWSEVVYTQNLPTFKTLFGNQSIEGDGNIDLYKHVVSITGEADSQEIGDTVNVDGHLIFYSSNNLDCNSLTDLKTVLGDTFIEKAFGFVTRPGTGDIWSIDYVDETYVYFYGTTSQGQTGKATVPFTMEIVDNVTTI